jgi:hypothetical protein
MQKRYAALIGLAMLQPQPGEPDGLSDQRRIRPMTETIYTVDKVKVEEKIINKPVGPVRPENEQLPQLDMSENDSGDSVEIEKDLSPIPPVTSGNGGGYNFSYTRF